MLRRVSACLLASSLVLALSGCGWFDGEEREEWRVQAEAACIARREVQETAYMSLRRPLDGPGVCGIDSPFVITALLDGAVRLKQEATLGCPVVAATERWLGEVVQPAALIYMGAPVVEIESGSYSCRTRNSRAGARLSEHAFGNAVDVMAFILADGRRVTIARGWGGAPEERGFLREVFVGACAHYTTVLGPGSDGHHEDHLHMDLARHDASGTRRHCRPQIEFESRLHEAPFAISAPGPMRGALPPAAFVGAPPAPVTLRPAASGGTASLPGSGGLW